MSMCSTAVGLLATFASIHIAISVFLGVLIGFVLHIDRRSKAIRRRKELEKTTGALVAAGRTLTLARRNVLEEQAEMELEDTVCEVVAQEQEKTAEEADDIVGEGIRTNPWAENVHDSTEMDILQKESLDKPVVFRRIRSPMNRTGTPLSRTGSPLLRTGSPLLRTESPIGDVARKARLSMISIASNISSRFRKSVDLSEEEAKLVLCTAPSVVIDDSDYNGDEGVKAITGEYKLDESAADSEDGVDQQTATNSDVALKITFPWEASESSC